MDNSSKVTNCDKSTGLEYFFNDNYKKETLNGN